MTVEPRNGLSVSLTVPAAGFVIFRQDRWVADSVADVAPETEGARTMAALRYTSGLPGAWPPSTNAWIDRLSSWHRV